jgi:hypothetical protein
MWADDKCSVWCCTLNKCVDMWADDKCSVWCCTLNKCVDMWADDKCSVWCCTLNKCVDMWADDKCSVWCCTLLSDLFYILQLIHVFELTYLRQLNVHCLWTKWISLNICKIILLHIFWELIFTVHNFLFNVYYKRQLYMYFNT